MDAAVSDVPSGALVDEVYPDDVAGCYGVAWAGEFVGSSGFDSPFGFFPQDCCGCCFAWPVPGPSWWAEFAWVEVGDFLEGDDGDALLGESDDVASPFGSGGVEAMWGVVGCDLSHDYPCSLLRPVWAL